MRSGNGHPRTKTAGGATNIRRCSPLDHRPARGHPLLTGERTQNQRLANLNNASGTNRRGHLSITRHIPTHPFNHMRLAINRQLSVCIGMDGDRLFESKGASGEDIDTAMPLG